MMNTENIRTVDIAACEDFLRWVEKTTDEKRMANYENILGKAREVPLDTFVAGLKSIAEKIAPADDNPMLRLAVSPVGVFQTGLLLGYAMALSSVNPDFIKMVSDLQKKTENVTPISAAKGFK